MRIRSFVFLAMLPVAGILSGCGAGMVDSNPLVTANAGATLKGKLYGGQQPISNAVLTVYAAGTGGYGRAATALAQTNTAQDRTYLFTGLTCTNGAPLYLLSVGGDTQGHASTDPGYSSNTAAVLGAGLGLCTNGTVSTTIQNSGVVINELSTVALSYAGAKFFSATNNPTYSGLSNATPDGFGGPSAAAGTYSAGLSQADAYTVPALVPYASGQPNTDNSGATSVSVEYGKIFALGNSLAACVNSSGSSSTPCQQLFSYTTSPNAGGVVPADTLQAAVNIARFPYQNVSNIFGVASFTTAFNPVLSSAPPDWSLGITYTTSNLA